MADFVDALLELTPAGYYDISFSDGDIKKTKGLTTAIFLSIFTDARASASQIEQPERRRGWIGNIGNQVEMGSTNWIYEQARLTNATTNGLIDSTRTALQWLIDFGYATSIDIVPIRTQTRLEAKITIFRPDSSVEDNRITLWEFTPDD